ncbi:trypsin-like peptidase domain-containing protein [Streptomyces ovatisporus]|uniref:Trypsin-like peptidase domain-containing protein n=1 Tax=Streptomyces ovatisporus TaxID=1128682 RepID=A0ABV9A198_9ACTN
MDEGYDARYESGHGVFWGSGFFIAPGWVLTSAHVVGKGRGAVWRGEHVIGITTESGATFTGLLACGLPRPHDAERPPSPWGDPDLALVRVPDAEEVNCLWLSDRSQVASDQVELHGYSSAFGGGAEVYVHGAGAATGGPGGPLMLQGSYLPAGCSGGPVVDRNRGSVIGVNKGRAKGRGESAALATAVTELRRFCDDGPDAAGVWSQVLRAHDRHHLQRYLSPGWSWPREQFDLEAQRTKPGYSSGFTAYDRAELYGRFAELPPPLSTGQVLEMVNEARREVLRESYRLDVHAPRSWREGAGLLYSPRDGRADGGDTGRDLEREAVLLYAAKVCAALSGAGTGARAATGEIRAVPPVQREAPSGKCAEAEPDAVGELKAWVKNAAVTLRNDIIRQRVPDIVDGLATAAATTHPSGAVRSVHADVLVEIDPDFYGTHAWRIKLIDAEGQITPVRNSEIGVPRAKLEGDIRAALADALDRGDIGEHLAALDFMLPRALFDEPVETWRAREADPGEGFSEHSLPLGHRRTVAVRDLQRRCKVTPEWRSRWSGIAQGPLSAIPLCSDVPEAGHESAAPETDMAAYGRLRAAERHAVPVHCARAGSGRGAAALGVALAAGHPAALWRRCDERHDDCEEFYSGAADLLRAVGAADGPDGLRELVLNLRNRMVDPGGTDTAAAWAEQLILLYDPPDGPQLSDHPLRAPQLRP